MKKRKIIDTSYVKKIEIDESTHRPIIVDVPESEYLNQPIEKADFVEKKSDKSRRKELVNEKVFGIKKIDDSVGRRQKFFKTLTSILFIVFMVGSLAYTAYKDFFVNKNFPSPEQISEIFSTGWLYFIIALLCLALSFFFKGLKNVIMCKSMTGKSHFLTGIETAIIGTYYNNVTPLAVGGQPFEIYHLSKHGVRGGVATSIPIASFFTNQLAFVILGIVSLVLFTGNIYNAPATLINAFPAVFYGLTIIGLVCCLFVPSLVIIFSFMPKFGAKLVYLVIKLGTKLRIVKKPEETMKNTIKTVVHNSHCLKKIVASPLLFIGLILLSFLENIASVSIAFFVLKGFGLEFAGLSFVNEWIIVCSICFILFASITFIPTPGNSGAADLSFFILFESVLFAGLAFPAMLLWRLFHFYSTIIIGFLFATLKKKSDLKKEKKLALENQDVQLAMDIDNLTEQSSLDQEKNE